jgi:mono/diheme cytochrome c family protein
MPPPRLLAALVLAAGAALPAASQPAETTFAEVSAVLRERCVACHAGPAAAAGLRLDTLDGLLKGAARGPVVKSGDPGGSELVRRIRGSSLPRMPMTGPPYLDDAQIALIERWIAGGLRPGGAPPAAATSAASPPRPRPGEPVTYAHVAPIFATRCAACHTERNGRMGPPPEGFVLTSHPATLSAADRVRVVPGRPQASELMRRIRGQARPRMPLDGPSLADEEIDLIERWIAQGARDAAGRPAPMPAGAAVRLHGTLDADGRLDGLELDVRPQTRVDGNPGPGSYVQARGRLGDDGRVRVERLRAR